MQKRNWDESNILYILLGPAHPMHFPCLWNHAAIEVALHLRVERNSRIVALENEVARNSMQAQLTQFSSWDCLQGNAKHKASCIVFPYFYVVFIGVKDSSGVRFQTKASRHILWECPALTVNLQTSNDCRAMAFRVSRGVTWSYPGFDLWSHSCHMDNHSCQSLDWWMHAPMFEAKFLQDLQLRQHRVSRYFCFSYFEDLWSCISLMKMGTHSVMPVAQQH